MNKSSKIVFAAFLFLVVFLTYLEATEPDPINLSPSYMPQDKIPLGAFVFFQSWKNNHMVNIEEINLPPYEFLTKKDKNGTYFFLNDRVNFDENELNHLLSWVHEGNNAFISADFISENLLDTLNIEYESYISEENFIIKPALNFVHPELHQQETFEFNYKTEANYFIKIDTINHLVLGTAIFGKNKGEEKINFIKAPFGDGSIFLHTIPEAFGNYFLLSENNYKYAEKALSYINQNQPVLWDNYYKSGKSFYSTPLYILLSSKSLKWAYYFVILGSILFIIFEGKRKQRAIPVIHPLKNKTYEYTKTIGDLYLEQNRYKEIASKKITLFLDYIRRHYRISTENQNEKFLKDLAAQSGNSLEKTKALFQKITLIQNKKEISKENFLQLATAINVYKQYQ